MYLKSFGLKSSGRSYVMGMVRDGISMGSRLVASVLLGLPSLLLGLSIF